MAAKLAAAGLGSFNEMPLPEARARMRALQRSGSPAVASVTDRAIPGPLGAIAIRVYEEASGVGRPALVFAHGGGWAVGDLDSADALCREIAGRTGCVVISVDYRLAPEHKFPAPLEDLYTACQWISSQASSLGINADRIAIAGESAGGNLAASYCLLARDRGMRPFALQILVSAALDAGADRLRTGSSSDPILSMAMLRWSWSNYLETESDGANPLAAPLRAESFSELPPALLMVPTADPLCADAVAYAEALRRAGTPATLKRYDGVFHGFLGLPHPVSRAAMDDVCGALGCL